MPPYVRIIGPKNSGKTCLVEALVSALSARSLRVGTVKHDAHEFDIDHPGKDTWRHRRAGSAATVICSDTRLALMRDVAEPPAVSDLVRTYLADCDIVLVEGYKSDTGPVICLGGTFVHGDALAAFPTGYGLSARQVKELADRLQALIQTAGE